MKRRIRFSDHRRPAESDTDPVEDAVETEQVSPDLFQDHEEASAGTVGGARRSAQIQAIWTTPAAGIPLDYEVQETEEITELTDLPEDLYGPDHMIQVTDGQDVYIRNPDTNVYVEDMQEGEHQGWRRVDLNQLEPDQQGSRLMEHTGWLGLHHDRLVRLEGFKHQTTRALKFWAVYFGLIVILNAVAAILGWYNG